MSCISPFTVPISMFPRRGAPVSASKGFNMAIPPFIAFAANKTSGTNSIPSRKSIPTIRIPSTKALVSTSYGIQPRPRSIFTDSAISSFIPSYKSSCICNVNSSSLKSANIISCSSDMVFTSIFTILMLSLIS